MSKEDQRATYIYLTEKGNNIIQTLMSDYRKLIVKVNIEDIEMLVRKVKDANPS